MERSGTMTTSNPSTPSNPSGSQPSKTGFGSSSTNPNNPSQTRQDPNQATRQAASSQASGQDIGSRSFKNYGADAESGGERQEIERRLDALEKDVRDLRQT